MRISDWSSDVCSSDLTDVPLVHDPGTVWEYGTSTDWLGLLVERVSGLGLDEYIEQHVPGPLGMSDVTFDPSADQSADRRSAVSGKSVSVRVDLGGRRIIQKKKKIQKQYIQKET